MWEQPQCRDNREWDRDTEVPPTFLASRAARLPPSEPDANMHAMKILAAGGILAIFFSTMAWAETPNEKSSAAQLEAINKKLDEQNAKIDALSQQILKLQEQVSKPGVMIGEPNPAPTASSAASPDPARASGNTHTVTRGETLTSIAKQYKVGVEELQKFNHIENDRKLQIGQTIMIPGTATAAPAASAEPSPAP
jgi:LysM repeat protein